LDLMKRIIGTFVLASSILAACSMVPKTPDNCVCNPAPKHLKIEGEGLTLAQVEAESMEKVKFNPNVPQVPMGAAHKDWEELKATFKPQDRFYRATFSDGKGFAYGGYLIMRGPCMVTFWQEWIS